MNKADPDGNDAGCAEDNYRDYINSSLGNGSSNTAEDQDYSNDAITPISLWDDPFFNFLLLFTGIGEGRIAVSGIKGAAEAASANRVENVAKMTKEWLSDGSRLIKNKSGDTVIISKDGTRRVRFDINNPSPHSNPHAHIEELINGKWLKSGPIYPKDVPNY